MEKTGSENKLEKLGRLAIADARYRHNLEQTKEFRSYTASLELTRNTVEEIGKTKDLDLILNAEKMTIVRERAFYAEKDKSILPSLNAAIADFSVIESSVKVVRNHEQYQAAASTYHTRKKTNGIVNDGFHEAINGHITRLGNRISALGVSAPEKAILRQRQASMRLAKTLYVELQREALKTLEPQKQVAGQEKQTGLATSKKPAGPERA